MPIYGYEVMTYVLYILKTLYNLIWTFFFLILQLTGMRKKLVTLTWKDENCSTVEVSGLDIGWGQVTIVHQLPEIKRISQHVQQYMCNQAIKFHFIVHYLLVHEFMILVNQLLWFGFGSIQYRICLAIVQSLQQEVYVS